MDIRFPDPVAVWNDMLLMIAREQNLEKLRGEVFSLTGMAFDEIEHASEEQLRLILKNAKKAMEDAIKNAPQSEA